MTAIIKAEYAFLCDDVRQENNGKFIFIGAYSGDISISEFPTTLPARLVIYLTNSEPAQYNTEFEFSLNSKKFAMVAGSLTSAKPGGSFVSIPIVIRADIGTLNVRFRQSGKR